MRLLTLTGPGGVGKTRLALQVAEDALEDFEDGVFVRFLAPLEDAESVMGSVAGTIGMQKASSDESLAEQMRVYLHERQMLLVLDNFEHLLGAAAQVTVLLAACPHVKMLVTSREPLRIGGEQEMPVAALDNAAAVELFVQRAWAVNPALEVSTQELATVETICKRVDRLPLAIELAAVWTKVLPLPELLERLSHRLDLLTSGRRDAPERQRTLRDTIAWSEHLLEPGQQRLFRRLAIFAGGLTSAAAEVVCADADANVLEGLASLVEKSLLQVRSDADGSRFWTLETIREYALEGLRASGEEDTIAARHAEYYSRLAPRLAWVAFGQDDRDRELERELPNFRLALAWERAHLRADLGLRLAAALGRYWFAHGGFEEGEVWLREMLDLDGKEGVRAAPLGMRVRALYQLILFTLDRRNYDQAEALAREGLELARRAGDGGSAGDMLAELGHVAEGRGDLDGAMDLLKESLVQVRIAETGEGERRRGGAVGRTLSSLGNLARTRGDYIAAQQYLEEALAWGRERSFSFAVASVLTSLGHLACDRDDYTGALGCYRESLDLYRTLPNPEALAWCLEGAVVLAAAFQDYSCTARLCGAIASLRLTKHDAPAEWPLFTQARESALAVLGQQTFTVAYEHGSLLSQAQAIAEALGSLDHIASRQA